MSDTLVNNLTGVVYDRYSDDEWDDGRGQWVALWLPRFMDELELECECGYCDSRPFKTWLVRMDI